MNTHTQNYDIIKNNDNNDDDNELLLCVLVNGDLNMEYGKIVNFCCQSIYKVVKINESFELGCNNENYIKWCKNGEKIVILKAKEEDLLYCVNTYSDTKNELWCENILDSGNLNINLFSIVCVAFTPTIKKDIPEFILKMKEL